ncbi:MAG: IS200/IS605 family transposase [Anaerolineales bacterium]|nr:IS200/IS605 family transposase [Anaerolineales bacterium]
MATFLPSRLAKLRQELIIPEIEERLLGFMAHEARELNGSVMASGAMPDHVHLLATIPPSVSISNFVKQLKGSSSRFVTRDLGLPFEWQAGYGVFTIDESDVPGVKDYVLNQKAHHKSGQLIPRLEWNATWNYGPGDSFVPTPGVL